MFRLIFLQPQPGQLLESGLSLMLCTATTGSTVLSTCSRTTLRRRKDLKCAHARTFSEEHIIYLRRSCRRVAQCAWAPRKQRIPRKAIYNLLLFVSHIASQRVDVWLSIVFAVVRGYDVFAPAEFATSWKSISNLVLAAVPRVPLAPVYHFPQSEGNLPK